MITLARNHVNNRDRDVSTEEKARIVSRLISLPASAAKDVFVALCCTFRSVTSLQSVQIYTIPLSVHMTSALLAVRLVFLGTLHAGGKH